MNRFVILDGRPMPVAGAAPAVQPALGRTDPATPGTEPAGTREPGREMLALIDPHALRRASMQHLLKRCVDGIEVTCFASAAELVATGGGAGTGLGMIVVSLGGTPLVGNAIAGELEALCARFAQVPVVVMSDREDSRDIVLACHLGARGYLPTTLEPSVAQEVLHLVRAGGTYLPATRLVEEIDSRSSAPSANGAAGGDGTACSPCEEPVILTPRQAQVLKLLCQGRPNKVIAHDLGMEESTVKVHVRHIMRKLGASNRTEVALRARETTFATNE